MKVAFATVIHPGVLNFWKDFIISVQAQTYKNFNLVVLNDGCSEELIIVPGWNIEIVTANGTILENRVHLIDYLLNTGYDWVVFGDSDDYFSNDRVEKTLVYANEYDIVANELIPFTNEKQGSKLFSSKLGLFKSINAKFIRDKNIFGLSNVACKISCLHDISLSNDLIAGDWYLFARAIYKGATACFIGDTYTYYRQWEHNIIGIQQATKEAIITGIKAKYNHYKLMQIYDDYYGKNLPWLEELMVAVKNNAIGEYANIIEQESLKSTFWWQNIKYINNEKNNY